MSWSDQLKVAIVTKDTKKIASLTESMPEFEDVEQMKEALFLIKEAYVLMNELRDKTLSQINQIKKNIEFLESNPPAKKNNRLDISM